jgi:hypothetical protein
MKSAPIIPLALLAVGGCAATPSRDIGSTCNAGAITPLVGRTADNATIDQARKLSGARTVRVVAPGDMMTMDYRPDRLNLKTDGKGRIATADCG